MQSSWYQVGLVSAHEKIAAVMQGSFSAASGSSFPKSSFARETGVWRNRRENVSVRTACIYGEQSVFSAAGLAKPAGIFKLIRKPNLVKFLNSLSLLWKLQALGSVRAVHGVRLWNSQGVDDGLPFGGIGFSSEQRLIPFIPCLEKAYPVKSFITLLTSYWAWIMLLP